MAGASGATGNPGNPGRWLRPATAEARRQPARRQPVRQQQVRPAIVEGRQRLLLFVIAGGRQVPWQRLTPASRFAFTHSGHVSVRALLTSAVARGWRGFLIAFVPLIVLAATALLWGSPGWMTWLWCSALCAINAVFLVGGPILWNGLITAGIAIDQLELAPGDNRAVADWLRTSYGRRGWQGFWMLVGSAIGVALLWCINLASEFAFTLGIGEYLTMAVTAGLAVNGLWILWWIAGLIPTLGEQPTLRLDWHNPARTPAIVFLNRALWKASTAISIGMILLASAVQGQPSPFTLAGGIPPQWYAAVIVQFIAFLIVGAVFVRDGFWAQWKVFRLVRVHIDNGRKPIDEKLVALTAAFSAHGRRSPKVLYYAELDRHFDSLRAVDLKLGWALTWATSIVGALVSVLASAIKLTPG